MRYWWRIVAKALGEKAHQHNRIADQVALVRFCILLAYMTTNIDTKADAGRGQVDPH